MHHDERDRGPITTQEHRHGVSFGFVDQTWDVRFPPDWWSLPVDEDDLWGWTAGDLVGRIRLRRHPRVQLEVDVTNNGTDVAQVRPPRVALAQTGSPVPWFAGSAGEVVSPLPDMTVLWVQHRGSCVARTEGFGLFPEPLLLRPGQGVSAVWRRTVMPPGTPVPEPAWVPRQRYLPLGEVLEVEHADAALAGDGLRIVTTLNGSRVDGDPGLHHLSFLDARGTALVEVGWFASLMELAGSPAALADPDPNLVAWLLAASVHAAMDLDVLDTVLAHALEQPTAWGAMAGMRAATRTDLPVAAEVRAAARVAWAAERDPHLRRLMITHALICGWEPEVTSEWLTTGPAAFDELPTMGPQEMLASIGFGRITSSPSPPRGRSVALAALWLTGRAESARAAEWEHAVEVARRRLMCSLSRAPAAADVAWLLAHSLVS